MLSRPLHRIRSERGMTLVEVMMVIFLIGLTSSIVVFTMPERVKPIEKAADRLTRDVRMAADRAILTGRVQGIDLLEDGYARVEWQNEDWVVLRGAGSQREDAQIRILNTGGGADEAQPELIFDPTGVNEAFDLELMNKGERLILTLAADGEIRRDAR